MPHLLVVLSAAKFHFKIRLSRPPCSSITVRTASTFARGRNVISRRPPLLRLPPIRSVLYSQNTQKVRTSALKSGPNLNFMNTLRDSGRRVGGVQSPLNSSSLKSFYPRRIESFGHRINQLRPAANHFGRSGLAIKQLPDRHHIALGSLDHASACVYSSLPIQAPADARFSSGPHHPIRPCSKHAPVSFQAIGCPHKS